jgi:hypothetical protein
MAMDNYKFELIRADEAQQITYSMINKFQANFAEELVEAFVDFASGCGFYKKSLYQAMQRRIDEEPIE